MVKLSTIQKRENLNEVYPVGNVSNGGAYHTYEVFNKPKDSNEKYELLAQIKFRDGPRNIEGSIPGIIDVDLLEIVRHRLQCFQAGPYASHYNEHALKHIEEALHCMNARVEDKIERNVLGTNNK